MSPRTALMALAVAMVAAVPSAALGHPGVEDRVHRIDHQIAHHPRDARLYLRRGELFAEDSRFEEAKRDFDKAEQLAPKLSEVHYYRGAMHLDAGEHAEAETELSRFLEGTPDHMKARFLRAEARAKQSKHRAAADDYSAGLAQMAKPTPKPYFERAQSLVALGPKYYAEALEGLDKGCDSLGSPIVLVELAVDIESRRGDHAAALQRLERLPAKLINSPHWLKRRGDLLRDADRHWESIAVYVIALGRISHLPDARRQSPAMAKLAHELRRALASSV